jgi:hypothetical protein
VTGKMKDDYGNPFSVCFNMMKIRYADYDRSIDEEHFLVPTDKVNVFINFESVLHSISSIKDIDKKLILERNFPIILTAEALNLCAHYKKFFRQNNLDTKVYLYNTDLNSSSFTIEDYNEDYRSYYSTKFMNNPRYAYLGEKLVSQIIPDVITISQFIPNVYFINTNGIEGSLVPLIISNMDPSRKNFIVTHDIFDTQYQFNKNFMTHFIRKSPLGSTLSYTIGKTLVDSFRDDINDSLINVLSKKPFFFLLLSVNGDKSRSIEPIKGIGIKTVVKLIQKGIDDGVITENTDSIELLIRIFPEELRDAILNNYNCFNLELQLTTLKKTHFFDIESQLIDRSDINSLVTLNHGRFYQNQLMLEQLTC